MLINSTDNRQSYVSIGSGIKSIADICIRVTSGGTPRRSTASFYEDGIWPWVKTKELTDGWLSHTEEYITDVAVASSSAKILPKDTILMAMYGATVGKLGILNRSMACNQACCAMIVDPKRANFRYLFYQLLRVRPQIKRLATGAAQQNLSGELIKSLRFTFPHLSRQHVVADCLGSLDDLIEAGRQKLKALQQHKQGLMQQLFPQIGEAVPRLRFPEFKNAVEWTQTPLDHAFGTITNGRANAQDHQGDGAYPLFDRSKVVKRSRTFLFDGEAVILPGEGMRFQPQYFNGKFNLHQRAYALMEPMLDARFAFYALDRFKEALADSAVQSTVRSLRMSIIENFAIPCPTSYDEQQMIAECLGSLDHLIAADSRKLEALQQYKWGLMQQLFPSLEDESQ